MDRFVRQTIELKKLNNVFNEVKADPVYKRHKKDLKKMGRKIDNYCPIIATSTFFSQKKLKEARMQMEYRARANMRLVSGLNMIMRARGKVDCYNPVAAFRNSKVEARILEQKHIENLNKKFYKILKSIEASKDLSKKELNKDWQKRLRYSIIEKARFPIAIRSLVTPEFDLLLDDPPSHAMYSKSYKALLTFHRLDFGPIGKVVVMLYPDCDEKIVNRFMDICKSSEKACVVSKILKDILIEVGEKKRSEQQRFSISASPANDSRNFPGTLSMLLEKDGSVQKLCLTLIKFPLDEDKSFVIGRVVKGFDTLIAINSYGTRFGFPSKTIYIQSCNLFK